MRDTISTPSEESKISRVFSALMAGGKFTRFEAERYLSDHCLPSTISEIQKRYGADVSRQFVTVPGYQGNLTSCCEYWIASEERIRLELRKGKVKKNSDQANKMSFQTYEVDTTIEAVKPQNQLSDGV